MEKKEILLEEDIEKLEEEVEKPVEQTTQPSNFQRTEGTISITFKKEKDKYVFLYTINEDIETIETEDFNEALDYIFQLSKAFALLPPRNPPKIVEMPKETTAPKPTSTPTPKPIKQAKEEKVKILSLF